MSYNFKVGYNKLRNMFTLKKYWVHNNKNRTTFWWTEIENNNS